MHKPSIEILFGYDPQPEGSPSRTAKQTRRLIHDYNALGQMQAEAATFPAGTVPQMLATRAMVWALLLADTIDDRARPTSRTLSLVEVGDIIATMPQDDVDDLVRAINQAREIAEAPKDPTKATEQA